MAGALDGSIPQQDTAAWAREISRRAPLIDVVGDLILDDWWQGSSGRLAREAPVPVVDAGSHRLCPGGAANVAANLAALGARVRVFGVVGADAGGDALRALLVDAGVDVTGVVVSSSAATVHKTRIVADGSVVMRVDESTTPSSPPPLVPPTDRVGAEHFPTHPEHSVLGNAEHSLSAQKNSASTRCAEVLAAAAAAERPAAGIVADYGHRAADSAREAWRGAARPALVVVDAHDPRAWRELRPDVVTPNLAEAELLLRRSLSGPERAAAVVEAGGELLEASGASHLFVTLDIDGSVGISADDSEAPIRTRTRPAPERCASGAGDTFTAALTAALAVGAPHAAAAALAQRAADVVVADAGTSVCTSAELARDGSGVFEHDDLAALLGAERARGHRIVFTNGCFDVLHRGHVASLGEARALGDLLVVAINSDASVTRLKGPGRPINNAADRAAVLAGLGSVDAVTVFDDDTPAALIRLLKPDVYVKGGDYSEAMLAEAEIVRGYGGQVRMLGYVADHSTTELVERIRGDASSDNAHQPPAGDATSQHQRPAARRSAAHWAVPAAPDPGRLDVLIPTRDRPAELAVTLAGLAAQDAPAFRVVVSDQSDGVGPADFDHPAAHAMVRVLEAQGHPVVLERNLPRLGLAQQRQHLLELSLQTAPDADRVLFLDDDVWLEPDQLAILDAALERLDCGFVGEAVQGLSYLDEPRPDELDAFEPWTAVGAAAVDGDADADGRWRLHNAANLAHLAARLGLEPGEWLAYKIAWVGGCVLFDRRALVDAGGFEFWRELPPEHAGEDVAAQRRVMARRGGAGILPSGAVHLESPTTVVDRSVDAWRMLRP